MGRPTSCRCTCDVTRSSESIQGRELGWCCGQPSMVACGLCAICSLRSATFTGERQTYHRLTYFTSGNLARHSIALKLATCHPHHS